MNGKAIAEIRRRLAEFGTVPGGTTFYATVMAVDEQRRTCTVQADGVAYDDVRLHAVADPQGKGFCFVPAVESVVLVSRIGGDSNELLVAMFSTVDRVLLTIGERVSAALDAEGVTFSAGDTTLEATTDGLELSRGTAGLLKSLSDLCDAIARLTVSTAVGPSSVPINSADFMAVKNELKQYLTG